jgi:hypothetical protein
VTLLAAAYYAQACSPGGGYLSARAVLTSEWLPVIYRKRSIEMDGVEWGVSSTTGHGFEVLGDGTLRFEIRKGDHYSDGTYSDPEGVERSEIGEVVRHPLSAFNGSFRAKYKFMVEEGPPITAPWLVMGQLHSGLSRTPPFEIKFEENDRMKIVAKFDRGNGRPVSQRLYQDSRNIRRGHWYTMEIDVQLGPHGNGHVKVWRDGLELVNFRGKVGYADQETAHWRLGIYRGTPLGGETIAALYKDVDLSYGAAAQE